MMREGRGAGGLVFECRRWWPTVGGIELRGTCGILPFLVLSEWGNLIGT